MAKKSSSDSKKATKMSSGLRKVRRANKEIMRIKMKISRWNCRREKTADPKVAKRWNTSGLEKRMSMLQAIVK